MDVSGFLMNAVALFFTRFLLPFHCLRIPWLPGTAIRHLISRQGVGLGMRGALAEALPPEARPVEEQVDDGSGVERHHLADDEAADDGDPQGPAQLGAD